MNQQVLFTIALVALAGSNILLDRSKFGYLDQLSAWIETADSEMSQITANINNTQVRSDTCTAFFEVVNTLSI